MDFTSGPSYPNGGENQAQYDPRLIAKQAAAGALQSANSGMTFLDRVRSQIEGPRPARPESGAPLAARVTQLEDGVSAVMNAAAQDSTELHEQVIALRRELAQLRAQLGV